MNDPLIHPTIKAVQIGEAIGPPQANQNWPQRKHNLNWYPENNRGIKDSILKPKQL